VPRSVGTLPVTITAFGLLALLVRAPISAAIARGAEVVTRNSIYRAGYELIYAPLGEDHKRPAKVVLDVGADRIGDLLGAQLVGLIVYVAAEPRVGLLVAAVCVGMASIVLAIRLPSRYTTALEDSLIERASEPRTPPSIAAEPEPWVTLDGLPSLGQAGEFAPLSLRFRAVGRSRRAQSAPPAPPAPPPSPRAEAAPPSPLTDDVASRVADLRSGDAARILRALQAGLMPELAGHAIDLLGRDEVARPVATALGAVARRSTGALVDALLDHGRDLAVRRRLPGVLVSGEPVLAAWGLWRALGDPSFEVRYRAGAVLARLAADGHLQISTEDVFEAVRRELLITDGALTGRTLEDLPRAEDERAPSEPSLHRPDIGLEHVFTVLGLALPAEPLRIALHAVQTDDVELRGTALEYLESILPPDVRAQLWPLLEGEAAPPPSEATRPVPPITHPAPRGPRTHDEILEALHLSYPRVLDKLRQRAKPA
jgi:hypothetical protein